MAGITPLHGRVAVLIIVDVLCFSTAVDVAVSRATPVYPFPFAEIEAGRRTASQVGASLAYPRKAASSACRLPA